MQNEAKRKIEQEHTMRTYIYIKTSNLARRTAITTTNIVKKTIHISTHPNHSIQSTLTTTTTTTTTNDNNTKNE